MIEDPPHEPASQQSLTSQHSPGGYTSDRFFDGRLDHAVAERRQRIAKATGSTIVYADPKTVVDPPTRHADEMSAERPPSGRFRARAATV
jgi:hypothetical protein